MNGQQQRLATTLTSRGVDPVTARSFASKVIIGPGCWYWTGSLTGRPGSRRRFARFFHGGSQNGVYAHVWLFTQLYGEPAPDDRLIRTCHIPWCVSPNHIRPASHGRAIAHGKAHKRRRHLSGVR